MLCLTGENWADRCAGRVQGHTSWWHDWILACTLMPLVLFCHLLWKLCPAFRKETWRQNINFLVREFLIWREIEACAPSISFLDFFSCNFRSFFSPSHLQTCNLPNCLSTITPALHRRESSVEWLPKIKNIFHNMPLSGQSSRPHAPHSPPSALDSYSIFLSILGCHSALDLCAVSFFLSPPPSSFLTPSLSPISRHLCSEAP